MPAQALRARRQIHDSPPGPRGQPRHLYSIPAGPEAITTDVLSAILPHVARMGFGHVMIAASPESWGSSGLDAVIAADIRMFGPSRIVDSCAAEPVRTTEHSPSPLHGQAGR